ncbi:MAG: hypothetical protein QM477_01915 [Planctomycetota bacterium]
MSKAALGAIVFAFLWFVISLMASIGFPWLRPTNEMESYAAMYDLFEICSILFLVLLTVDSVVRIWEGRVKERQYLIMNLGALAIVAVILVGSIRYGAADFIGRDQAGSQVGVSHPSHVIEE